MQDCSAFSEPVDDYEPTIDKAMDNEEDDDIVDESNALVVFDRGDDEA